MKTCHSDAYGRGTQAYGAFVPKRFLPLAERLHNWIATELKLLAMTQFFFMFFIYQSFRLDS